MAHHLGAMRLVVLVILCALPSPALAHDVRGEALILDIGEDAIEAELHVPLGQLALARDQDGDELRRTPPGVLAAEVRAAVTFATPEGEPFAPTITHAGFAPGTRHGDELVVDLRLVPPPGRPARRFTVRDELVLHAVTNANVFVFSRRDLATGERLDAPTLIGALHYQQRALAIEAALPATPTRLPWLALLVSMVPLVLLVRRFNPKEVP